MLGVRQQFPGTLFNNKHNLSLHLHYILSRFRKEKVCNAIISIYVVPKFGQMKGDKQVL
jgi:hypothetical protein